MKSKKVEKFGMLGSTKISTDRKISLIKEVADRLDAKEEDFIIFYLNDKGEIVIKKG